MESELLAYIQKLRDAKVPDGKIRDKLVSAGWDAATISNAMHHEADPSLPEPPAPPPQQHKGSAGMWEGFEHVLMFLSMYCMATALGMLLHQFINKWSPPPPDPNNIYMNLEGYISKGIIRWSIATLFVTYPLFAYFYTDIYKRTIKNSAVRQLRSRKIFTYLTLVGTFIIGVGKIVQTVFTFLDGNVSRNFFLHLFVTMTIVAVIFYHYLKEVKDDRKAEL